MSVTATLLTIEPQNRYHIQWYGETPAEDAQAGRPIRPWIEITEQPHDSACVCIGFENWDQIVDLYTKLGQMIHDAETQLDALGAFSDSKPFPVQHSE